ncbi:hypothetical protein [Microbacterium sp. SD291]|uniref:hypothetical protein n=1 Tax=Microbacterium sp. SD291 TaxID=2782007 RepID=UPI001A97B455|nr:hypothetical protein [Microbacterium sp. SD291]MBO0980876.1 hypothetical protein [Microbacterium sp. SD291]
MTSVKKFLTRAGVVSGLTAALVLGSGASAFAHECFIPNRSDKGNESAANSQQWTPLADIIAMFAGDAAECLNSSLEEQGVDTSTLVFGHHTLGENRAAGDWMADGAGVDHLFAVYGPQIGAAFEVCGLGPA